MQKGEERTIAQVQKRNREEEKKRQKQNSGFFYEKLFSVKFSHRFFVAGREENWLKQLRKKIEIYATTHPEEKKREKGGITLGHENFSKKIKKKSE